MELCPYFGNCGGCTCQHISYELQLENKRKALERIVGNVRVFSGKEYFYRNRMDFAFHAKGLGLRRKDKWFSSVDIERCIISTERINSLLKEVRSFFTEPDFFDIVKHTGTIKYAVIRTAKKGSSVSFVLNSDSSRIGAVIDKIKEFSNTSSVENVVVCYVPSQTEDSISEDFFIVKGTDRLEEEILGKMFYYPIQGFFQNNTEMMIKMHEYCQELLKKYDTKNSHLLDLYAGVGTFGIVNAELFKSITLIESFHQSISFAKENIALNSVKNVKAIELDAKQLKKIDAPGTLFVVTDPPRSGMHPDTIQQLKKLRPKAIIYISCNVEQLKKDLPKFSEYKVASAALFDFFPQTNHCESVVELVLKQ